MITASIIRDKLTRIPETREPASRDFSSISSLDGSSHVTNQPKVTDTSAYRVLDDIIDVG